MTIRNTVAQQPPRPEFPWRDFPRHRVHANSVFYRSVRNGYDAWWFCACGECRFDLPSPRGTCYLGTDPVCGVLETVGFELHVSPPEVATPEFFQRRKICSVRLSRTLYVANLASEPACRFRVTNELSCMIPYDIPQQFAALFDQVRDKRGNHRFHGIRYRTRLDTASTARGLALFDAKGKQRLWTTLDCRDIDDDLLGRIRIHYPVVEAPAIDDLDVVGETGMDDVA